MTNMPAWKAAANFLNVPIPMSAGYRDAASVVAIKAMTSLAESTAIRPARPQENKEEVKKAATSSVMKIVTVIVSAIASLFTRSSMSVRMIVTVGRRCGFRQSVNGVQ